MYRKTVYLCMAAVIALCSFTAAAVMDSAVAWYKLDYADSGVLAAASEVADSQANPLNGTYLSSPAPQWTSAGVPVTGTSDGRALKVQAQAVSILGHDPSKLHFNGAMTIFTRAKVYDSSLQSAGSNWLVSRKKDGGGYVNSSWGLRYQKWGSFYFDLWSGGTKYTVTGYPTSSYTTTENAWWNIFAEFDPGQAIRLTFYDMDGNLVGTSGELAVSATSFNNPAAAAHTTIGGQHWSSYNVPYGALHGEIEQVAIWNGLLSENDRYDVMIPEPATMVLLGIAGGIGMLKCRRSTSV